MLYSKYAHFQHLEKCTHIWLNTPNPPAKGTGKAKAAAEAFHQETEAWPEGVAVWSPCHTQRAWPSPSPIQVSRQPEAVL